MKKTYFSSDRLVFKGPTSGQSSSQEVQMPEAEQQAEKPKSMGELNEESKKALASAKAEKENIERQFGKPDGTGDLPEGTPPEIRENYANLNETIKKLSAAIGRQRTIMEESLKKLGQITTSLDEYAVKSAERSKSGDPLATMPYRRAPEPTAEPAPEQEVTPPAKAAPAKKETVDSAQERIMNDFCARFEEGSNEVTEEEAKFFRSAINPKGYYLHDVPATDDKPGHSYEIEISKDKKWIRVTSRAEDKEGRPKNKYTGVLALEKDTEGTPEFALKTDEEALTANIETNKTEVRNRLSWLATDEAPLGSVLILSSKIETRKNYETGTDERFMQSYTVKKGVDGLRFATLEFPIDADGKELGPVKEVKSDKSYTVENALAMVAEKETIVFEGTEKDRKAEIKKGLSDLGYNLIAQLPMGGKDSPNFKETLHGINDLLARYNVTKWSYRHPHINYLARYEKGTLTIYDPSIKNPEFKNAQDTPDVPRFAVKEGPIDMSQYA